MSASQGVSASATNTDTACRAIKLAYSSARCRLSSLVVNCGGFQKWRPRPMDELNRDLSKRYGVPVEFGAKTRSPRGNRPCARSWRYPSRSDRDIAYGDTRSASVSERRAVRHRGRGSCEGAQRERNAQEGLGPTETSALAGRQPRQHGRTFRPGGRQRDASPPDESRLGTERRNWVQQSQYRLKP